MLSSEFSIYGCGFLSPRVNIRNSTLAFFIPEVEYDIYIYIYMYIVVVPIRDNHNDISLMIS